ncbi:GNAT family N-acetyltransferase [Neobacillus cucumis]|nr:GNAT family N-acetyltransferase [Neobacillus cucumis]
MNIIFKPLQRNSEDYEKVNDLIYESFPEVERLPISLLFHKTKLNGVDFFVIYDKDTFVGFTYLITRKNLTYVQYLAIDTKLQSKGYGSQILSTIKERYSENQIVLNIEADDERAVNYEQRVVRKKFYIRNGYKSSGLSFKDRWGVYEVMVNGEEEVNRIEFIDLFKGFVGNSLFLYLEIEINTL